MVVEGVGGWCWALVAVMGVMGSGGRRWWMVGGVGGWWWLLRWWC